MCNNSSRFSESRISLDTCTHTTDCNVHDLLRNQSNSRTLIKKSREYFTRRRFSYFGSIPFLSTLSLSLTPFAELVNVMNAILFGIFPDMVAVELFLFFGENWRDLYILALSFLLEPLGISGVALAVDTMVMMRGGSGKKVKEHKTVKMFLWVTIIFFFSSSVCF